jgi:hypothetical protein
MFFFHWQKLQTHFSVIFCIWTFYFISCNGYGVITVGNALISKQFSLIKIYLGESASEYLGDPSNIPILMNTGTDSKFLCEEGYRYNFGKPLSQRLWKNSRWWKTETESWFVCPVGRIPFPYFTLWGRYGTVEATGQRQSPVMFVWWERCPFSTSHHELGTVW